MTLRKVLFISLFLMLIVSPVNSNKDHSLGEMHLLTAGDLLRLQMEARVGAVSNLLMSPDRHNLVIEFEQADINYLKKRISQWAKINPLLRSARVYEYGSKVRLGLQFKQAIMVLDESVVALKQDWSRWEIVISKHQEPTGLQLLDPKQAKPELDAIALTRKGGMVELSLAGNESLVAEVSFQDKPSAVILGLPGVPRSQLEKAVRSLGYDGLPSMVNQIAVSTGKNGVGQLIVMLAENADLAKTTGVIRQKHSILNLYLVADAPAKASSNQLIGMGVSHNRGRLEFSLLGAESARVNAYTLEKPSRLMVDFLGWTPDQVYQAVKQFNQNHDQSVTAVRYGETRMGSARVELELPTDVSLVELTQASKGTHVVKLDAPGLSQVLAGIPPVPVETLSGLDLRYSPEHNFDQEPEIIISPLQLANAENWAGAPDPLLGERFHLLGMYDQALNSDSVYLAAQAEFRALSEAVPQARADYLPVASFDYKYSAVQQNVTKASNAAFPTGKTNYPSQSWSLTITQPIIKVPAVFKMNQADISVEQAKLNLLASEQDLILRVAEAYLNLLAANDAMEMAKAEREAVSKQMELARVNFESGLGNITELHDAEGRYALTQTKEINAMNNLDDARMRIKEMVNTDVSNVHGFKADFAAELPQPSRVAPWLQAALTQNLALQSRRMASDISELEIKRQKSGHLPTLDLVASYGADSTGGSIYGNGQDVENGEIGVELSVPIFSGGATTSLVREAAARWEQAKHQQEEEYRRTERLTRQAFLGVLTSAESLAALRKMVKAQNSGLSGKLEGFKSGIYTVLDVLDAYRLYYAARSDYLKTRYTYLLNRLRLKQAVGALGRDDLADLASLLEG